MRFICCFLLIFPIVGAQVQKMEQEDAQKTSDQVISDLMNYWNRMKELHSEAKKYRTDPAKVVKFSWSDCGAKDDPMHLTQLTLEPSPMKLPGNIIVTANGGSSEPVIAPLQMSIVVYKKVLIWVKVPCLDGFGSCSYEDACLLDPFKDKPCPPPFIKAGLPCKCPIKAGTYQLTNAPFFVNPVGIPSWLEDGSYKATATFNQHGKQFGCLNLAFDITH